MIPKDLLPSEVRENTLKKVSEVLNRFLKEGMPLLHPEDDMKVRCSLCLSLSLSFANILAWCSFYACSAGSK